MQTGQDTQNNNLNTRAVDCMEISLQIRELKYILQNPCKTNELPDYIYKVKERFLKIDAAMKYLYVGQHVYVLDLNKSVEKHLAYKMVTITVINNPLSGDVTIKDQNNNYETINVLDGIYIQQTQESKL